MSLAPPVVLAHHPSMADDSPSTSASETLRALLAAYDAALSRADVLPRVVVQRLGSSGVARHVPAPRLRLFVRFFLVRHIRSRISMLVRRHDRRAALGAHPHPQLESDRPLETFRNSLPSTLLGRAAVLLGTVAVLLTSRVIAGQLLDTSSPFENEELQLLVQLEASCCRSM